MKWSQTNLNAVDSEKRKLSQVGTCASQ